MNPCTSIPSMTVPALVIVRSPSWPVSTVPAGTPVVVASGRAQGAGLPAEGLGLAAGADGAGVATGLDAGGGVLGAPSGEGLDAPAEEVPGAEPVTDGDPEAAGDEGAGENPSAAGLPGGLDAGRLEVVLFVAADADAETGGTETVSGAQVAPEKSSA